MAVSVHARSGVVFQQDDQLHQRSAYTANSTSIKNTSAHTTTPKTTANTASKRDTHLASKGSKALASPPAPAAAATSSTPDTPAARLKKPSKHRKIAQGQLLFSSSLILLILGLNQAPALRPHTAKLLHLQYVDPNTGSATIGTDDAFFVAFAIVVLTFARALFVDHILNHAAAQLHVTGRKQITRFVEQGWSVVYYTCSFLAGLYLFYVSDYWLSASDMWRGWPHYQLPVLTKAYYLIQLASWFHQIFVLHIEERRKDHRQMFTHHIVTCLLIIGSYYYYYTRVGHVVLILMDVVDILLSLAKVFNYANWRRTTDTLFVAFMASWMVMRHGIYGYILYSAMTSAFKLIPTQCFFDANGELVRCFTPTVHWTLVGLLWFLQFILLYWFLSIVRVALKVVRGGNPSDVRSDSEDSDSEDDEKTE